jgi:hypothetical protein
MLALTEDLSCQMPEALLLIVDVDPKLKLTAKGFLFARGRRRFEGIKVCLRG